MKAFAPPPPFQGPAVSIYVAAPQPDGSSLYMNYATHLLQSGAPVAGEEGYMSFLFADPNGVSERFTGTQPRSNNGQLASGPDGRHGHQPSGCVEPRAVVSD